MKSKVEVLRSLIGNNTVVISGHEGGYVVTSGKDPASNATSVIDEVGDELIHAVTPRYKSESWIDIAWISEVNVPTS